MNFVLATLASPVRWLLHLTKPSRRGGSIMDLFQQFAILEKGERDDRAAALALHRGEPLPPPTAAQLEMRRVSFAEVLDKLLAAKVSTEATPEAGPSRLTARGLYKPLNKQDSLSVECVICCDMVECFACLNGPCGHYICRQCVVAMAEVASNNEELFPLQCCQKPLPTDVLLSFLPGSLRAEFACKSAEAATPPDRRVYCPNKRCSNFIGRRPSLKPCAMSCPACGTNACSQCKSTAHPHESCDDKEIREVRALAKEKGWKICPKCEMIVERADGCHHMRCRCRQEFCYACGKKWGKCKCS